MQTRLAARFAFLALALSTAITGCAMERGDLASGSDSALTGRPYFEVWRSDASGDHYFHLVAANHEIILSSQGYSSRTSALNGMLSVLDNGENPNRYELRLAANGQHYFVLKAANGRVIGSSELYGARSAAARGAQSVQDNVADYLDWLANRTGARIDVFPGMDGRYYFNVHAGNGEIVLSSQGYAEEASAYNGALSVADNGLDPARYEVLESADGGYYFNLTATNGRVIGTSEVYASRSNAERGRDAVIALLETVEPL
jgi:uncharacterized protein YegP (UPF0339 family)